MQRLNKHSTGRPWSPHMCRQLPVSSALQALELVTKARHPLGETSKGRSHDRRMWSCQLSTVLGGKGAGLSIPQEGTLTSRSWPVLSKPHHSLSCRSFPCCGNETKGG